MPSTNTLLYRRTPEVTVLDNRSQSVRNIVYHRHPDLPMTTDERITHHRCNARGHLMQSIDARLYIPAQTKDPMAPNFVYQCTLTGEVLRTDNVDAGNTVLLKDTADRMVLKLNALGVRLDWHYEGHDTAGRLLTIAAHFLQQQAITQRYVWADSTPAHRARNLVGTCIARYDPAGVTRTESLSLTGQPLAIAQQILRQNALADWQGELEAS